MMTTVQRLERLTRLNCVQVARAMSFAGKVVLETGGSSGIGADAARHLAELGASVAIVGRNEKRLNEVADRIVQAGSLKPLQIVADVTEDAERIIDDVVTHFGHLDVLVNSAGIATLDSVTTFDLANFDRILNTNLRSVVTLTSLAVPHLENTKGNVVNVSSVSGQKAADNFMSYCISKAGLDQYTKCAAITLGSKGIRVNAICPGVIRTPIFETSEIIEANSEQFFKDRSKDYLVGRVGEVSDTSSGIAYLASAPFVTGILLPVDGGSLCSGRFSPPLD